MRVSTKFNLWVTHMDLYFSPLACSMASRIAFYEADQDARFIEVDTKAKRTLDGENFLAVQRVSAWSPLCAPTTARC